MVFLLFVLLFFCTAWYYCSMHRFRLGFGSARIKYISPPRRDLRALLRRKKSIAFFVIYISLLTVLCSIVLPCKM